MPESAQEVAEAIASVEVRNRDIWEKDEDGVRQLAETITTYKYKFWDKGAALGRLEKHLGMYVPEKDDSGENGNFETLSDDDLASWLIRLLEKSKGVST